MYTTIYIIGVHFHDEVVDGHTMDVVRQTSNVLACLDTHTPQPSTLFSLTGQVHTHTPTHSILVFSVYRQIVFVGCHVQVVGRRRRAAGTESEVLVRWRPRL